MGSFGLDFALVQSVPFDRLRLLFNDGSLQTLGVLDVDGLDVAVELLGCALLIVSLSGDAYADAERDTLDSRLPDLLVQLRVDTDILGTLKVSILIVGIIRAQRTIACSANALISLIARGAFFLKVAP